MTFPILLCFMGLVAASNPFNSDVIALTPKNWKEVEESPHAWFVNACRATCGYCARLTPEWQKLAGALKKTVKIAYWDIEQGANTPPLIGQIKGTPTIKLIKPSKKNPKKKEVVDYNGARESGPMKEFCESHMPSFVEKVEGLTGLETFLAKAEKHGLPRALVFSDKPLSSTIKALSTDYRRRILIGEVRTTKSNAAIVEKYEVGKDLPRVVLINAEGNPTHLDKKPTHAAIDSFFSKHALKKPVAQEEAAEADKEAEAKKKADAKKADAKKVDAKKTKDEDGKKKEQAKKAKSSEDAKKQTKEPESEPEPETPKEEIDIDSILAEAAKNKGADDKINYYQKSGKATDQKFQAMKIKELKQFLLARGEPCAECVEKSQFVKKAIELKDAPVVQQEDKGEL